MKIERASRAAERMMVPKYAPQPGYVIVDSTWGQIQPLEIAAGVQTIAELDVIEHLQAGLPLIDTASQNNTSRPRSPARAASHTTRSPRAPTSSTAST